MKIKKFSKLGIIISAFTLMAFVLPILTGYSAPQPIRSITFVPYDNSRPIRIAKFLPDGKRLFLAALSNGGIVYDTETGEVIQRLLDLSDYINVINFSYDGKYAIGGDYARQFIVWEVETGKVLLKETLPQTEGPHVKSLAVSQDGKYALTHLNLSTYLWDVQNQRLLRKFESFNNLGINWIDFLPDGRRALIAGVGGDFQTYLYDVENEEILFEYPFGDIFLDTNGRLVWVASTEDGDRVYRSFDVNTNMQVGETYRFDGSGIFNPARKLFVRFTNQEDVVHLEKGMGERSSAKLAEFTVEGFRNSAARPVFSPDGNLLLIPSGDTAYLYDIGDLSSSIKGAGMYVE